MAGWFYITTDIDPYPKTHIPQSYPEKGHHLHHIPFPFMAHNLYAKFHDKDEDVHQPKTDVRETTKNFYLDVELPGIKEHTDLKLRWNNERSLLLTSKTHRPEIPEGELIEEPPLAPAEEVVAPAATPQENGQAPNGGPPTATAQTEESQVQVAPNPPPKASQKPKLHEPHLTIHERLIGDMVRGFTFPVDVDRDNTHAKLDAGILRIVVPKVVHAAATEADSEKHFLHVPISILHHENKTAHPSS